MPEKYRLAEMDWMEVEKRLRSDTRVVIPLGATEEHGYLSLLTDTLFVDYVTERACARTGVLVGPVLPFGCSAFAINFPGTISLRTATMCRVIEDIVDSLYRQGFRRMAFVTGHGGNEVITGALEEAQFDRCQLNIYYKNAWAGMKESVRQIEKELGFAKGEHASWHEEFWFTRIGAIPSRQKEFPESADFPTFPINPRTARMHLEDGVVGGRYTLEDDARMGKLLEMCVDALADFLSALPRTPADE